MNKNKKLRKRVFNIMQYETNPITGESLGFSEANIISALSHSCFKRWGYGLHDCDTYMEIDEMADRERLSKKYDELQDIGDNSIIGVTKEVYIETNLVKKTGNLRPRHWHIAVQCDDAVDLYDVARWFNVPPNMVEIPNGRGTAAFLDCIAYIPHTSERCKAQGKCEYDPGIVKANFDWQREYADLVAKRAKYKKDISDVDYIFREICYEGMTLKFVRQNYPEIWVKHMTELKKLRADYLANLPTPNNRINYYICGAGRSGKGLLSRAVARTMFPNMDDDEIFFEVGADNVAFEGYDGQPVIIWNDCRSMDLFKKLGTRENIFNVFDSHPSKQKQNVKFGSINLVNVVNIVNSVQSYVEFLDGLAGEYTTRDGVVHIAEDKRQSYERFPVIIPIHAEDFELLFNRGYFYQWEDFTQYRVEAKIKANLPRIARACNNNKELENRLNGIVLAPIKDKLLDTVTDFPLEQTEEEIENQILNLGYGQLLEIEAQSDNELDIINEYFLKSYTFISKYLTGDGLKEFDGFVHFVYKNEKEKIDPLDVFMTIKNSAYYDFTGGKTFYDHSKIGAWKFHCNQLYDHSFSKWCNEHGGINYIKKYGEDKILEHLKNLLINCDQDCD